MARLFFFLLLLTACSANPYKATNKVYKKEARDYSRIIGEAPSYHRRRLGTWSTLLGRHDQFQPAQTKFRHHPPYGPEQLPGDLAHLSPSPKPRSAPTMSSAGTVLSIICSTTTCGPGRPALSKWGNVTDINSISIGIELDNNGFEPFPDAQINSLLHLLTRLKTDYSIPTANFIGHGDIAPTRKNDPSSLLPLENARG
jgi:N-acetylmuramoyl-L-alanine amidase